MRVATLAVLTCFMMPGAFAKTVIHTEEVVEEQDKTDTKVFCSKNNEKEAASLCEKWLDKQTKSLGDRMLTSNCSQGDMSSDTGCLYKATGEIKYVMKKYRRDTTRD